jgi:prolyl-tRNA editing enzyme YbaK/EbsC (Cys-tRNA(Pro) deacylase)
VSDVEQRVTAALDSIGVPYERVEIDPAFADTAEFCERYGYPLANSANTILVASKKEPRQFAACVVRADTRLDVNHRVRKLMGVRKLSFADGDETAQLTGMQIGGVTALALPSDLVVYVDSALMELDYVILGGGSRALKIKVAPELFRKLPNSEVIEALATPLD